MRISKLTVVRGYSNLSDFLKYSPAQFVNIYIKISLLLFMNNVVDVVGHLRLVNGQSLIDHHVLDEAKMISKRHILVHLQSKECFYCHYDHVVMY